MHQINMGAIAALVQMARVNGHNPIEIHANRRTRDEIGAMVEKLEAAGDEYLSPLQKLFAVKRPQSDRLTVFSLPVIENEKCMDGFVAVRPESALGNLNWLDQVFAHEAAKPVPWLQREPVAPLASDDAPVSVAALRGQSQAPTPTDVLMKCMETIEGCDGIVVIRCNRNGNMEMSSNLNHMTILGALQIAMSYVGQQQ